VAPHILYRKMENVRAALNIWEDGERYCRLQYASYSSGFTLEDRTQAR